MATANGVHHDPASGVSPNLAAVDSSEAARIRDILNRLKEPFDPGEIRWVVKATANGRRGKQGLALPYADCRTYSSRLNDVVTTTGWTDEYSVNVVEGFHRKQQKKKEVDKPVAGAKVLVVCKLTIFGLGVHSGTGEAWADDENVLASADAQAFKRACSDFGIGRYLYDIEGQWIDLDDRDRPLTSPLLPEWAVANDKRNGTGAKPHSGKKAAAAGNKRPEISEEQKLMSEIVAMATEVGNRLAAFVVSEAQGVTLETRAKHSFTPMKDLLAKSDKTELKRVFERVLATKRVVERIKAAVATVGVDEYKRLCSGLNCPGGISDIPDTKTLTQLAQQVEDRAKQMPKKANGAKSGTPQSNAKTEGTSKTQVSAELTSLRNRLLTLAQQLSAREEQRIGDVVAWASGGDFQFRDIGKLTDADIESLQRAVDQLERE